MTGLQLRGPMAFHVLQWCHPMLASLKEDKLLYPDDHLIWCSKVDSGPRISLPFLVDLPTIVGGLQIILQPLFGLNPRIMELNTIQYFILKTQLL